MIGGFERPDAGKVNAVATVVLAISLPMIAAAYLMRDEGPALSSHD
jgi:hypothetical protein